MEEKKLKKILDDHLKWLNGEGGKRADLRSANLSYANLRSANLRYAVLCGANLWGADLGGADLRSANLRSANLGGADLGGADLRSANLSYANLSSANLAVKTPPVNSHQFISEVLFRQSKTESQKDFSARIRIETGKCWEYFIELAKKKKVLKWAMKILFKWDEFKEIWEEYK